MAPGAAAHSIHSAAAVSSSSAAAATSAAAAFSCASAAALAHAAAVLALATLPPVLAEAAAAAVLGCIGRAAARACSQMPLPPHSLQNLSIHPCMLADAPACMCTSSFPCGRAQPTTLRLLLRSAAAAFATSLRGRLRLPLAAAAVLFAAVATSLIDSTNFATPCPPVSPPACGAPHRGPSRTDYEQTVFHAAGQAPDPSPPPERLRN